MAENDGQVTDVTDAERQAEWARLEGEEGQPAKAPEASEPSDEPNGADGGGQGDTPPHDDPAAAKPAGSETSPPADDPWKDAPEPLRTAYEAERTARERAEQTIRSNNGRLSAESRRASELEAELLELKGKSKPETKPGDDTPALGAEDRKRLEEEFPDVAAPLLKVIGSLEAKVTELAAGNASADERRQADVQLELQRIYAEEEQKLSGEHSDWRDVAGKPAFADWVRTQPRAIQEAIARNGQQIVDAAEASLVIGMYKQALGTSGGKTDERRERQLRGNTMPTTKVPGSTTSATLDKQSEWDRLEALDRVKGVAR